MVATNPRHQNIDTDIGIHSVFLTCKYIYFLYSRNFSRNSSRAEKISWASSDLNTKARILAGALEASKMPLLAITEQTLVF